MGIAKHDRTRVEPTRLNRRGRRGRASPGPNPIDVHVGKRLRERRTMLGLSQQELGRLIGITFQQLQKNERGTNRLSASRLFACARILDVDISFFFDEMPTDVRVVGRDHMHGVAKRQLEAESLDPMARRETIEVIRAYYDITDAALRKQMVSTMHALSMRKAGQQATNAPRRGRPPKHANALRG